MSNLLLLDPDETARRAMHGILTRGCHRLACVGNVQDAWAFVIRAVKVDLVFVELGQNGDGGMAFIERLRQDALLQALPVVIYTDRADRLLVKRGLELKAQNFLIKPYHDEAIFSEIAKAMAHPWRADHFEEKKAFCKTMGYDETQLHRLLESLRSALELARPALTKAAELRTARLAGDTLRPLREQSESVGAWGIEAWLRRLDEAAGQQNWADYTRQLETLECAGRLILHQIEPGLVPPEFLPEGDPPDEQQARDRALWFNAPGEQRCPVADWPRIQDEIDALPGCPIIDSVAASFRMSANGHPSCLHPLMDMVDKDPGLATQMLIVANQARDATDLDTEPVEDPRVAVGLLGEARLATQATGLVTAPERLLSLPPAFGWRQFWMFQLGTARMARSACAALEMPNLAAPAYTAGLLHDLGKLLLLHLHPFGLQAVIDHAWRHDLPLPESERLFLGCTTREMAAHFAEKQGLPRRFVHVLRWIDTPHEATEDRELVAVVSLARDLCRHNRVGSAGDKPPKSQVPLEESREWGVLRESVFPSFNLHAFEREVHAGCRALKLELQGRLATSAVA